MRTQRTPQFIKWLKGLKDVRAQRAINVRLARLEAGLFGDVRSVGGVVSELKVDVGAGYRVYFTRRAEKLVILLHGGDKGSQDRDIARAKEMAADLP